MTIEHSTLTGAQLHEPKGVSSASSGTVYVANGSGSGSWSNIHANQRAFDIFLPDIGTAGSWYWVAPFAGNITTIYSVINSALTSADNVLTFFIGGVQLSNSTITMTQSGSAAGDVDSSTPTANHAITAGAALKITTDGGTANTPTAMLTIVLTLT